jgi:hypothetical protein
VCQRNKSRTTPRVGELHALPVPQRLFGDIALNFIGPLPTCNTFNTILTATYRLAGYVRVLPTRQKDGAKETAETFLDGWGRFFGLPDRLVSDRDVRFTNRFWRT